MQQYAALTQFTRRLKIHSAASLRRPREGRRSQAPIARHRRTSFNFDVGGYTLSDHWSRKEAFGVTVGEIAHSLGIPARESKRWCDGFLSFYEAYDKEKGCFYFLQEYVEIDDPIAFCAKAGRHTVDRDRSIEQGIPFPSKLQLVLDQIYGGDEIA